MPGQPKYQRIAEQLRRQIDDGGLPPGAKLPTEEELQAAYGVSRPTVRDATDVLQAAGLVERRPGRGGGVFVREQVMIEAYAWRDDQPMSTTSEADLFFRTVREQGHEPSQEFSTRVEPMPADYAALLHVDVGSTAAVRRCLRLVDGVPHSIQDSWYPQWLCEKVPQLFSPHNIAQGTTKLLRERGYHQVAALTTTSARMPTPVEAVLLQIPVVAGTPVLHNVLTGYTADRPLRISAAVFAADKVRLISAHGDIETIARLRR
ncbi:GntR family transcriptional regulator [Catellatospora methionotrophica]|uniref:GntR family transcriptional regulator n=1 Tax=Catellatospora methionotrophica TaxID=121620 RepID=A0A8J3PJT0_9ACTN|nr:GntR family transcriptional regulator [Catellatospora methionotrophica]GIG18798.1 GntR family transcriptional regulator [Catellatospora methionotrophica]